MTSANLQETESMDALRAATGQLLKYCRDRGWAGYDPFDGLNSAVFAAIPGLNHKLPRLAFIQFMKRSPINFRPLCLVPREQNPKGVALFVSALIKLTPLGLAQPTETKSLVTRLVELRSKSWNRSCWGYNFDWQTRTYLVPRFTPNIICTTFAGNALLDAYDAFGEEICLEHAISAGQFLLEHLNRTSSDRGFCFSYTPLDRSQIHNANLLGAAFLARLYQHTRSEELRSPALHAAEFTMALQRDDGAWRYGEGVHQGWIDSFHTGYNLSALERMRECFPDIEWIQPSIRKGFDFFLEHFFTPEGIVKYYHDRTYPIDVHAIAQAVITLVQLRRYSPEAVPLAHRVYDWAAKHMRASRGEFIYQRHRLYRNRIAYMRWGQAWMLLAMASLAQIAAGVVADRQHEHVPTSEDVVSR